MFLGMAVCLSELIAPALTASGLGVYALHAGHGLGGHQVHTSVGVTGLAEAMAKRQAEVETLKKQIKARLEQEWGLALERPRKIQGA